MKIRIILLAINPKFPLGSIPIKFFTAEISFMRGNWVYSKVVNLVDPEDKIWNGAERKQLLINLLDTSLA